MPRAASCLFYSSNNAAANCVSCEGNIEMSISSLEQLERDAERSRAEFSGAVEELRSRVSDKADDLRRRVSPEAIKSEVKHFVDRTGHDMLHNIGRKASERPLEAIAVGAGLAYVGWRFLRNIPAPILLLGAGVALLRSSSSNGAPSAASRNQSSDDSGSTLEKVGSAVSAKAAAIAAEVSDTVSETAQAASRMASNATAAVSDAASSVYRGGTDAASYAVNQASQAGRTTRDNFVQAFERHPLIIGGVGLAIGAVIAASLPTTAVENRLLGDTSDDLRDRASKMGSEGYEAAKAAGQRIYDRSLAKGGDQSPDSAPDRFATDNAAARVQSAAEGAGENGRTTI